MPTILVSDHETMSRRGDGKLASVPFSVWGMLFRSHQANRSRGRAFTQRTRDQVPL